MSGKREAELIAALRPFADLAHFYADCEQHLNGCPDSALVGEVVDLTVGDFRRAAEAIAQASPPHPPIAGGDCGHEMEGGA